VPLGGFWCKHYKERKKRMDKITVNGVPLLEFIDKEKAKETNRFFQEQTRKYWKGKSYCHYLDKKGHGKVKAYEDWEIFVYVLDQSGIDITDLDIDQLSLLWKTWKKFRRI
jgi:hypothetical protein